MPTGQARGVFPAVDVFSPLVKEGPEYGLQPSRLWSERWLRDRDRSVQLWLTLGKQKHDFLVCK